MKLKIYAFLLFMFELSQIQAQTMYVKQSSGTQAGFTLNSVRKMTFSTGNLTVQKSDNNSNVYTLNNLRYLNFSSITAGVFFNTSDNQLIIYPNPIVDVLNIDLSGEITKSAIVSILTLDGKILQTHHSENTDKLSINLSHLSKGM